MPWGIVTCQGEQLLKCPRDTSVWTKLKHIESLMGCDTVLNINMEPIARAHAPDLGSQRPTSSIHSRACNRIAGLGMSQQLLPLLEARD